MAIRFNRFLQEIIGVQYLQISFNFVCIIYSMIPEVIATILLTIAFIPGVICKIPKNASNLLVTCVHALLFTIAYMLMRTYLFDGVIESMVSEEEEESKPKKKGEMSEEETKISTILSKLSVEQTKELSQLSSDELTELAKLVAVMEDKQVDTFLEMSVDKIKEMIKEVGEKIEEVGEKIEEVV